MQVEKVAIASLVYDPANARKHDTKNLEAIKGSLARFGQQKVIVVDKDNVVVAGNGTLQAAKELGWTEIEIHRTKLTGTDRTAFAVADNRASTLASWDDDVLSKTLESLKLDGFDLSLIGFDDGDLAQWIKTPEVVPGCDEDEVPEVKETRVKPGDLWQLGKHRLLCGDSGNVQNIQRLMNGEYADMVFTDPPYRMDGVDGGSNQLVGKAARKLGERIKHLCDFDPVSFLGNIPTVFEKNKMNTYIFCNKDLVPDYLNWALDNGYSFNILFWKKPNAIPLGGSHRPDVEYLLLFRKGAIWNNAVEGCTYSRCLDFPRELSKDHPTLKPVGLIENEIKISSNPGGIVAEFFLGSGSTLIASEKTGRRCYGAEIDEKYCDVILARWEKFTGQQAVLLPTE